MRTSGLGLTLVSLLAAAGFAVGQDSGIVADPITRDDVARWSEVLDLSEAQREAIDGFDRSYRTQQRTFRDDAVAAFLRDHPQFGNTTTEISDDVTRLQDTVRAAQALQTRLRQIDAMYLDRVAAVLAEDQLVRFAPLRAERARQRYLGGPAQLAYHRAIDVDLTAAYEAVVADLTAEERAPLDAMHAAYAAALDRAARAMHEYAIEYKLQMARDLRAAGPADPTDPHGEFALRAGVIRTGQTGMLERAADVGDVHRRFRDGLSPVLDTTRREEFRRRFLVLLYPRVSPDRGAAEPQIGTIFAREDLPEALREAVLVERALYRAAVDRVVEAKCDTIDAQRRSNASHSIMMVVGDDYTYDDPRDFDRALEELSDDQDRINLDTLDRLQGLVDEHMAGRITIERPGRKRRFDDVLERGLHSSVSVSDGVTTFGYKYVPLRQLEQQLGAGRGTLTPISRALRERWARELALSVDAATVLELIHDDYLDAFGALRDAGVLSERSRLRSALFARDAEGRPAMPTEADVRRLFDVDRAAVTAVRALDRGFFDSATAALGDALPESTRRRLERERARAMFLALEPPAGHGLLVIGAARSALRSERERPSIDMAALVRELECADRLPAELLAAIEDYEVAATAAFERAYDATRRLDEQRLLLVARFMRFDEEDGIVVEGFEEPEAMAEIAGGLQVARDEALALNRALRGLIEEALPPGDREAFTAAYKRAAWPNVYRDSSAVHGRIEGALRLVDLSTAQHEAIGELAMNYRRRYEILTDAMIEADGDGVESSRLRAARQELNDEMDHELKRLLSEEQLLRAADPGGDS